MYLIYLVLALGIWPWPYPAIMRLAEDALRIAILQGKISETKPCHATISARREKLLEKTNGYFRKLIIIPHHSTRLGVHSIQIPVSINQISTPFTVSVVATRQHELTCTQQASCQPTCNVESRGSASGSNWRAVPGYFWVLFVGSSMDLDRKEHLVSFSTCGFYYSTRIVKILLFIISVLGDYWGSSFKAVHHTLVAWVTLCYLNLALKNHLGCDRNPVN